MRKEFGYARVSTASQKEDRQIQALLEYGIEERKSNCVFNCGLWLTMYYFQLCSHRIGQVSNEEVAMLL